MAKILETKSVYFNDVNLMPQIGKVKSRKDIPNALHSVFVSPMVSLIGPTFVKEAARLGLSVTVPRFLSVSDKMDLFKLFKENKANDKQKCFIAIGPNEPHNELKTFDFNTNCKDWLIDCANGYIPQYEECVKRIGGYLEIDNLMVGNVVTAQGIHHLSKCLNYCNNLYIRVGIGNGKACSSSDVSSINRGQITELMECRNTVDRLKVFKTYGDKGIYLFSDGGISKGGFVMKAVGAGADGVMMGGYFSHAIEAETHITGDSTYFGCASEKQNKLAGLEDKHSEGKVHQLDKTKLISLETLVKELWGGISSGISYCGHDSLESFVNNGVFEIKENSLPPRIRG